MKQTHMPYWFILYGITHLCWCTHTDTRPASRSKIVKQSVSSSVDAQPSDDSITPHFGTTHFIVGQAPTERTKQITTRPARPKKPTTAHFSPHGNVRMQLLHIINQEKEHIQIAVFVFTDKQIADALIAAHKRGVMIEIIIDPAALKDRHNKIGLLYDAGIKVTIYNLQKGQKMNGPSTMHHKFAIFYKNADEKPCLWTGSCNFTKAAFESNQECAFILYDPELIKQFKHEFETLKSQTYEHTKQTDRHVKNIQRHYTMI